MISKKKQNYSIDMKFDPKCVRKDTSAWDASIIVANSTMDWGTRCRTEFVPVKNVEEFQIKREELRKFAKSIKSKSFEPISILISDGDKLYATHLGMPDSSKK